MNRKYFALILIVVVSFLLLAALFFSPTPMIADADKADIFWIQVDPIAGEQGGELEDIEEYPEEEILAYLSQCKERRTLSRYQNDNLDKITLWLCVIEDGRTKHIVLGERSYSHHGYHSMLFDILEAEEVTQTLWNMLPEAPKEDP